MSTEELLNLAQKLFVAFHQTKDEQIHGYQVRNDESLSRIWGGLTEIEVNCWVAIATAAFTEFLNEA